MRHRRPLAGASSALLLVLMAGCSGCEKTRTPQTDPARTPPAQRLVHAADRGAPASLTRDAGAILDRPGEIDARFIVFGDSGTGSRVQYRVGRAMTAFCRTHGCPFGVHVGDIIYPRGIASPADPGLLTKLEMPYKDMKLPLFLSLGNHDHYGNAGAMVAAWADGSPSRGRGLLDARIPARYYTFLRGGVRFVVLDTEMPDAAQERWAIDALRKSREAGEPWIIAVGHHPRRSTGLHGDAVSPQRAFLDRVLCHRVDLYLSGHDHNMELMRPHCGFHQVVSGAADAVRPMRGGPGSIFSSSDNGWAMVEIRGGAADVTFYNERGNRLFHRRYVRRPVVPACGEDGLCVAACPEDPDCARLQCGADARCEPGCTWDPDCAPAAGRGNGCPCDRDPRSCEARAPNDRRVCGCDPACQVRRPVCSADWHCDPYCPAGEDPDCS